MSSVKQYFTGPAVASNVSKAGSWKQTCTGPAIANNFVTEQAVESNLSQSGQLQAMLHGVGTYSSCCTGPALASNVSQALQLHRGNVAKSNLCKQYFTGPTVASKREMTIFALYLPISSETQI